MEERAKGSVAFLHIAVLAAFSVAALVGTSFWQLHKVAARGNQVSAANQAKPLPEYAASPWEGVDWQAPIDGENPSGDPDGLSNIEENVTSALLGSYAALQETGLYSPEDGTAIAEDIAASLKANVSYRTYAAGDLSIDQDTSYERVLAYREDLKKALEPLLENPGYEFGIFANYLESRDATYGDQLRKTAENYRAAIEQAALVIVPSDAAEEHARMLNALSAFASTIEAMERHVDDAFAAAALIGTYNATEQDLFLAFDALAAYQKKKTL